MGPVRNGLSPRLPASPPSPSPAQQSPTEPDLWHIELELPFRLTERKKAGLFDYRFGIRTAAGLTIMEGGSPRRPNRLAPVVFCAFGTGGFDFMLGRALHHFQLIPPHPHRVKAALSGSTSVTLVPERYRLEADQTRTWYPR